MATITREITVDVAQKNLFFKTIVAKQYDNNSRFLKVTMTNEGKKINVDADSTTVIISTKRADKQSKAFAGAVNEDGTVTVPLTSWMLELDDVVTCDISIVDAEGRKLTSTSFNIEVEAASYSGDDISDDENYDLLITLLAECAETKKACEDAAEEARSGVKNDELTAKLKLVETHNVWNDAGAESGYVTLAGAVNASATLKYLSFEVTEGDVFRSYSWLEAQNKYSPYAMRFVTAYDSSGTAVSASGAEFVSEYTVPSGIARITVTLNIALVYPYVSVNTEYVPAEPCDNFKAYYTATPEFIEGAMPVYPGSWRYSGALEDGGEILFPYNNVKKNTVMSFSGVIGTLGTLTLGRKQNGTVYAHAEIDSASIRVYSDATTLMTTFTHGLTLTNNMQVKMESKPNDGTGLSSMSQVRVRLISNGSEYVTDWVDFTGESFGSPFLSVSTGSFTSCQASWSAGDANCRIYAFGDSYFGFKSPRWTKYLYNDGYEPNVLLNGYAGETSNNALLAFLHILEIGHPDYCFWCMGMNDPDSGAVSSSWQSVLRVVISYCEDHGITPILATVPCTPTVDNSYKNEVVRASGYRYVDFAKAVGGEATGSSWYAGMLSDDGLHPTDQGALALYMQILADFPEITVK